MSNTFETVKGLIADRLGVSEDQVTLESKFKDDLGADSLDVVELIMELEDQFNVQIGDDEAENLVTVGDVVNHIEQNKE
jgi:acyl carrier protein